MTMAFGQVRPGKLVSKVQKLDLSLSESAARDVEGTSAADEIIRALEPLEGTDRESEVRSLGGILKTIVRLSTRNRENSFLGPQVFITPMVQNKGVQLLYTVLQYIEKLPDQSLDRWRTHAYVV